MRFSGVRSRRRHSFKVFLDRGRSDISKSPSSTAPDGFLPVAIAITKRLEGCDMAAKHGLQILVSDEAGPHHAAMSEYHREQPNHTHDDRAMTGTTAKETKPSTVVANDPGDLKGVLKNIGGSRSDHWNNILANQTVQALWLSIPIQRLAASNSAPPSRRWLASDLRMNSKA